MARLTGSLSRGQNNFTGIVFVPASLAIFHAIPLPIDFTVLFLNGMKAQHREGTGGLVARVTRATAKTGPQTNITPLPQPECLLYHTSK